MMYILKYINHAKNITAWIHLKIINENDFFKKEIEQNSSTKHTCAKGDTRGLMPPSRSI